MCRFFLDALLPELGWVWVWVGFGLGLKIKPISIIGITETWISIDDTDIFSLCCEAGYNLYLQPRNYSRGGGVGILIHMDLPMPSISSFTFSYSDCLSCTFNFTFDILRIIVIYRPPRPDYSIFFDEFSDCINNGLHSSSFKFICMGDFNYHFDSMSQPHSLFRQLTESLGLHQHISCPTHTSGNILDLILLLMIHPLSSFHPVFVLIS